MTEDETFFAWLDGELGPAEAADMAARVAADPELTRLARRHRALAATLKGAFDPIAAAPVPERIAAGPRPTAELVDFAAARRARSVRPLAQWAAIAATLAVGVVVGTMIPPRGAGPVESENGRLYAAASLDRALDTQLASAPGGGVRIGLTFRDRAGGICRSFSAPASSGLACRDNGRWRLRGLFAAPEGQTSDYRMAAGMDPNLAEMVGSAMAGEPFDAVAEKAARDRGWK